MGWPRGAPRRRGAHAMAQMAQWLIRPWASHILRHAFTEYFLALVFIIVHTRSKMHLLGANNLLMPFKSNKLLSNYMYDSLFSYSAITQTEMLVPVTCAASILV